MDEDAEPDADWVDEGHTPADTSKVQGSSVSQVSSPDEVANGPERELSELPIWGIV